MLLVVIEIRPVQGTGCKTESRVVSEAQYIELMMSIDTLNKIGKGVFEIEAFVAN